MGAERWLEFAEPKKAKAYLKGVEELGDDGEFGCWLKWSDLNDSGGKDQLEVGYAFGGADDGEWAKVVCRELAKRFVVTRIGSDSVGWYDEPPSGKPYAQYKSWSAWMANCQPFEKGTSAGIVPEAAELQTEMNAKAVEVFAQLDTKVK